MAGIIGTVRACATLIGKRGALNPSVRYGHVYLSCSVYPQIEHGGTERYGLVGA